MNIYMVVQLPSMPRSSTQEYSEYRFWSQWKKQKLTMRKDSMVSGSYSEHEQIGFTLAGVAFVVDDEDADTGGGAPKL